MTHTKQDVLHAIEQLEIDAIAIGLCATPFELLHKEFSDLMTECDALRAELNKLSSNNT